MKLARSLDPLVVEVQRGPVIESHHLVDVIVTDSQGKTMASYGDPERLVFPRSAIKMIQALALVESGASERFGFNDQLLSLACASHDGESFHIENVARGLEQIHLDESYLECGAHYPSDSEAQHLMIRQNQLPKPIHNNCSGKHCGMLATAVHLKENPKAYSHFDHPVQARIRKILSEISGLDYNHSPWGVDGCGIPTYAIPLSAMAQSMACLLPDAKVHSERQHAAQKIRAAVVAQPLMISGTKGVCSLIIKESQGRSIAKIGAEGVYSALIPSLGLSVALKVRDGGMRAAEIAVVQILENLNGLTAAEAEKIRPFAGATIKNWAGAVVGNIHLRSQ